MKNEAIASEGSGVAAPAPGARRSACSTRTCAAAARPRTRARAYGIDARPVRRLGRAPRGSTRPTSTTRRCAATPRSCPSAAGRRATVARKLAALRALFRVLVEHGVAAANPADLLPRRRSGRSGCPRALKPADVAALLDRDPGHDAARAARPRAVRARLRVRPARRGARHPRRRLGRLRRRAAARRGQGRQDAHRAGRRARAARAARATSSAARRALRPATARAALFLSKTGRRLSTSDVRRRLRAWARHAGDRRARSIRTRCGTRSRPTCSTAAPTCARSRSCSDTHPSRRPRSTLG